VRRWTIGLWCLVAGCFPPTVGLEGKACDVTHPCGDDSLACVANVCRSQPVCGLPPNSQNLLLNGAFQEGLARWSADPTEVEMLLNSSLGKQSPPSLELRSRLAAGDNYLRVVGDEVTVPGTAKTLCASACFQAGDTLPSSVSVLIRGINETTFADAESPDVQLHAAGGWTGASISLAVDNWTKVSPRLVMKKVPGESQPHVFVDDVAVWVAPEGGCP